VDVAEAQRDLAQLEALRPHIASLHTLIGRAKDAEMALSSAAIVTALEDCALLKRWARVSGLDALCRDRSVRFSRRARATESPAQAA